MLLTPPAQIVLHLAAPCLCARFAKEKGEQHENWEICKFDKQNKIYQNLSECRSGHGYEHSRGSAWTSENAQIKNWMNKLNKSSLCCCHHSLASFAQGANILERSPAVIGVVFLHYFATNGRSTFCAFQHLLTNILSTPAFLNAEWVILYMNSASPPFVFVFVSVLYFFFLQKLSRTRSAPAQSKLLKLDSAWEAANGKMELMCIG